MDNCKIYVLKEPDGTIRYVGYTSKSLDIRFYEHLKDGRSNKFYHKANWIRKLLNENSLPLIELLEDKLTIKDAKLKEINYIKKFKELGFNLTNGTSGGDGILNPSDEVRMKMRDSHLGKKASQETKDKLSKLHLGSKRSKETKDILSFQKIGNKNPQFGKYKNKIEQIDINTGKVLNIFDSITNASKITHVQFSGISAVCRGIRNQSGGFLWRYENKNLQL